MGIVTRRLYPKYKTKWGVGRRHYRRTAVRIPLFRIERRKRVENFKKTVLPIILLVLGAAGSYFGQAVIGKYFPEHRSLNVERCSLRSVGDMGVTGTLDVAADTVASVEKEKVKEVAESVRLFLRTGKVADLDIATLQTALDKIVPVEYRWVVDALIAAIRDKTVPVGGIGADNVKRLDAICVGILAGCDSYDMSDRPKVTN